MKKRKKYPSQDDAQFMLDWLGALNSIGTGSTSDKIRKAFNRADTIRIKLHQEIFGDKSPWSVARIERKGTSDKKIVKWNTEKADKIGI